jgi:hypothetical protein
MDLPSYIREIGIEAAATLFEVSPHTAKAWMYRERFPRPAKGRLIVERTKGKVPLAKIYGEARG